MNKEIEVASEESLMKGLLANKIPVASSCQGDGICGKCRVEILFSQDPWPEPSDLEKKTLENIQANKTERLSCQAKLNSFCKIKTTYW